MKGDQWIDIGALVKGAYQESASAPKIGILVKRELTEAEKAEEKRKQTAFVERQRQLREEAWK